MKARLILAFSLSFAGAWAQTPVAVPFVGCASDGQMGPKAAPTGQPKAVAFAIADASKLAYYRGNYGPGVLGPRGWHCVETYGSNGSSLYVTPGKITGKMVLDSAWKGFGGTGIQLSASIGDTSGRFEVARMIALLFPAYKSFLDGVVAEGTLPASAFPTNVSDDEFHAFKGKSIVEYITPAGKDGLGTMSRLTRNAQPIEGVEILAGSTPDLWSLATRLPESQKGFAEAILRQLEVDAGY